jgi:hypothetical protein
VAKMAKQIARLLRTDVMADIDVPAIAQFLQSQGRRGDSVLAHINPQEAALLKKNGGAETVNPVTGLPEYFQIEGDYAFGADYGGSRRRAQQVADAGFVDNYDLQQSDLLETDYTFDYPAGGGIDVNIPMDTSMPMQPPITTSYGGEIPGINLPAAGGQVGLRRGGVIGLQAPDTGGRALAPDLTVPERVSAAQLGPSSMAAREAADRELAREGAAPGIMDRASRTTGLSKEALARLGLAGLGTLQGIYASRQAAEQGREARRETEALARPYQQRGQELIQQAQRGELTPQGQQSLQALRARLAQGAEARGGVGAAQAAAQIEAYRQNLLQNQFDYGQKISNIGDQLMLGAIRTGLEADRYASNLSNTYFTNMARIAAGVPTGTQGA